MMLSRENAHERAIMYRFLSRCYRSEVDITLFETIKGMTFPNADGQLGEGYKMLSTCIDMLGENAIEALAVDYASAFLAAGSADGAAAIPCESVYASPARIFMQEPWEEVRAEYAAHGLGKSSFCADLMEDHLACELEFMALLAEKNDTQAQKSFLENHLLNWVEAFVSDIAKYVRTDFYKAIGLITLGFLRAEAQLLAAVESGECESSRSYSVRNERMANILARLKEHYHVYAPKRFPKRGPKGSDLIRYGEIDELTDIVYKEKSHFSAKECFYPVSQTMFFFKGDECSEKLPDDDKGIILIYRACDINAIKRLDTIFLGNGEEDIYYKRMRDKLKLIMLECKDGFDNCFCAGMGTNKANDYSAAMRIDDICALMEICDEELLPYFTDEVPADFVPQYVSENKRSVTLPNISPEQFGAICAMDYWKQFDDKCISCGGCNTVCPTCSCFDTVDIIYDETSHDGERRRVWSSCMLRSFTETAGGGIVRDTAGANMRFKVMHKFFDFRKRFGGENMCVGCGRCIDRCPQGIDFLDVVNGLSKELEKGGESK